MASGAGVDHFEFGLAFADDSILFRQDGYLNFTAAEDGDYIVMIRESSYLGSANSKYRLHIGTFRRLAVYASQRRHFQARWRAWIRDDPFFTLAYPSTAKRQP